MTSSDLALADAHVTPSPLIPPLLCRSVCIFRGDDLPLRISYLSNWFVKPGLAQPPPALGEGDRDKDMRFERCRKLIEGRDQVAL